MWFRGDVWLMQLFEAVAFDMPVAASDGQGGAESGWSQLHACRAHFRYLRGGESVQAARLSGVQPVVVTVRNCADMRTISTDGRMRDTRRGDRYNINTIVEAENRMYLELTCVRGEAI